MSARCLAQVLEGLQNGSIKKVVVLVGAGVSTASGIPDFRSPGGMYDTLRPELLTASSEVKAALARNPTGVVSWNVFQHNAFPYLEVRRPFILGTAKQTWKMTIAHAFFWLLHERGQLLRVYNQNIDGLMHQTKIPREKIIDVHGSLQHVMCEYCQDDGGYTIDSFCAAVEANIRNIYDPSDGPSQSQPILCKSCGRASVKPATVLYGRPLPQEFHEAQSFDMPECDLLLVAGTSLTVYPAAILVTLVKKNTPRLIVNMDPVGEELGIDYEANASRDAFLQGESDKAFLDVIKNLGWLQELDKIAPFLCDASQALLKNEKNCN